jgi:hypothetical protein
MNLNTGTKDYIYLTLLLPIFSIGPSKKSVIIDKPLLVNKLCEKSQCYYQ